MIWFCDQTVGSPLQFIYVYMIGMLFACVLFKPLPYILKVHLYIFKRKHLLRRDGMMLWAWMMFLTREGWWRRREKGRRRRRTWARAIMVAVFGAGIQCQFTQQEERSLRWCVCVCGRSALALRFLWLGDVFNTQMARWGDVFNTQFIKEGQTMTSFSIHLFFYCSRFFYYILCHSIKLFAFKEGLHSKLQGKMGYLFTEIKGQGQLFLFWNILR